jgi:hypothetical protein
MSKENILDLIKSGSKLLPLIYKDLAQPGVKKAGQALATVIDVANTVLLPIKLANEKTQAIFRSHMEKYRKRMAEIPDDKVYEVLPEIGTPILDKLTYVTADDIGDLFVNLLASASSTDTIDVAHPSFINCINSMSSDEAKLIQFLSKADVIPYIQINALQKGKKGIVDVCKLTSLGKDVNFAFPNNIELYLDNFVTLGLLSCFERKALVEHSMYDAVIDIYNDIKVVLLASIKTDFGAQAYDTVDNLPVTGNRKYIEYLMLGRLFPNAPGQGVAELSYDEGFYRLTNYGKLFIRACTQS